MFGENNGGFFMYFGLAILSAFVSFALTWFFLRTNYQRKMKDQIKIIKRSERRMDEQRKQIKTLKESKDELIEQIDTLRNGNHFWAEQAESARVATHNVNRKLDALERIVLKRLNAEGYGALNAESDSEWAITLDDIREISNGFQTEISNANLAAPLHSTKIKMIDALFSGCADECAEKRINFDLKIFGSITEMIKETVSRQELETMIANHLKNAITAVSMRDASFRSILVIIGRAKEYYELIIHDTGVLFDVDTLVKLGTVRATTYANEGGNGIGFETTFKIINKYGASLIINEKEMDDNDFTKSITIRFDNKNKYIIRTYRPDMFPVSDRYLVKNNTL